MSNGELRHRAAELGVAVNYWDWQGHEVGVPDETLAAIVAVLEEARGTGREAPSRFVGESDALDIAAVAPVPEEREWGFTVQLYSLRSRGSWGHGDLRDLADLGSWSGRELGAGFVLINPLHAAEPAPPISASPYLPMTRRWVSPLYLRIEDIPEAGQLGDIERKRLTELGAPLRAASATAAQIDRDAVWTAKRAALEIVRSVPLPPARQASLDAFRVKHGRALDDWATWCALAEVHGADFGAWPAPLRSPRSAEVAVARGELASRVEFHVWVQWLVAEQLAHAQATARAAGMRIGVIQDLAIGASPSGADAWAAPDVLVAGFSVGAPPDAFNQRGQDWALRPWHPGVLGARGYRPLRDLIDATLGTVQPRRRSRGAARDDGWASGGGIRIDHVMGLSRLWWIPAGMPPSAGAYVHYDAQATLSVLASSAAAAGAVAIGEDLGTVEPWLRDALGSRGVLGTSMLWFERGWAHEPLAPQWWRRNCLATVSTHDLPPAAAFLSGSQVTDRLALGLLARSEGEERAEADKTVNDWIGALVEQRLLPGDVRPSADEFTAALYGYLARTPCLLIGVNLAEAVGEVRSQNMPGTHGEYPNWRLPLCGPDGSPVLLEDLADLPRLRQVVDAVTQNRP